MILCRKNIDQSNLKIGNMSVEYVDNFKCLGFNIIKSESIRKSMKEL